VRSRTGVIGAAVALVLLLVVLAAANYVGGSGDSAEPALSPVAVGTPTRSTKAAPSSPASSRDPESGLRLVVLSSLPRQAQQTVALIERGGPYPYAKDGAVFSNRERLLPSQRSGYYREYTVTTPGSGDRGARRIVTGNQDRDFFYSGDHYASFVRIQR